MEANERSKRYLDGGIRKGSEWWNDRVRRKVQEKKKVYGEWLQHGSRERYGRYKTINVEVNRMVREAKRAANYRCGHDFGRSYE